MRKETGLDPTQGESPAPATGVGVTGGEWLQLAKNAYDNSTTYVDTNYRRQWEDNLRHFQSQHAYGSRYLHPSYLYRSKIFRPKTRSACRQNEAAAMQAFFSNPDVVTLEPQDPNNQQQVASAAIYMELLNYRLDNRLGHGIPWFQTLIGAFQTSWVMGAVCSKQYWKFRQEPAVRYRPSMSAGQYEMDPESGEPVILEEEYMATVEDKPWVELKQLENIRIHPAADWTDPVQTSPYLIDMVPMYVGEVKERMLRLNTKTGQPVWFTLTDAQIQECVSSQYDTTRMQRDPNRTDKYDPQNVQPLSEYDIVWAHENFFRRKGKEFVFWTLGTRYMLTEPRLLSSVYHQTFRPYHMGVCVLEAHRIYPSGVGQLGQAIQSELNENASQRADNVKLVLNKRYLVKRGSQVDTKSLNWNVPGGVTFVGSIGGPKGPDVFPLEFGDVTKSAYLEQDRLNVDFDEIVGMWSASTINTNRNLGETVGGMQMLKGGTNLITEYTLRVFAETWVEPVLRQLLKLEQTLESDVAILGIAAQRAQILQKYGVDKITDELLDNELTLKVNVGMSATDPVTKVQTFMIGIRTMIELLGAVPPGTLDLKEIGAEIFGRLGYKDGARFWTDAARTDPEKAMLMQRLDELEALLRQLQGEVEDKTQDRQVRLQLASMKESANDRRKVAELATRLKEKRMDLLNPVVGEKRGSEKRGK